MHYITVNMSLHPVSSVYKKKYFCPVLLQFRVITHAYTLTSTHMHAYIHQKETQIYTVNNAMYPWHNQRQCKSE